MPIVVTNPYPEWQAMAAAMNCWGCCKLLWRREQTERHACDHCHELGVVADEETP